MHHHSVLLLSETLRLILGVLRDGASARHAVQLAFLRIRPGRRPFPLWLRATLSAPRPESTRATCRSRPGRYSTMEVRRPRKSLQLGGCCDHRANPRTLYEHRAVRRRPWFWRVSAFHLTRLLGFGTVLQFPYGTRQCRNYNRPMRLRVGVRCRAILHLRGRSGGRERPERIARSWRRRCS